VVRYADGEIFSFTRVTEEGTPAQFTLGPGDEFKFCWVLIVSRPLTGMTGGTLFEVLDDSSTHEQRSGYINAGLEVLCPHDGEQVSGEKATRLADGHYFAGHLDLRRISK